MPILDHFSPPLSVERVWDTFHPTWAETLARLLNRVACAEDHIVVYGWPGSVVTLFHAGKEVRAGTSERTPAPLTPPLQ